MLATFAALAEPTRLRIVEFLGDRPRSVSEICARLELGQPQASKHLRVLRDAGVVAVEARAQQRIYALRPEPLRALETWLARYRRLWAERLDQLDELVGELARKDAPPHVRRKRR
jgi:DNA-binding transcriptional ArsR family regulator